VLNGPGHFTLEHAALIDEFLCHAPEESEYFLLLVHKARAGNHTLARSYRRRMKEIISGHQQRAEIKLAKPVAADDAALALYYSSWQVSATHIALMTGPQSFAKLMARLAMPQAVLQNALRLLEDLDLVSKEKDVYCAHPARWHLPPESPWIRQHHQNWRRKVIQKLDGDRSKTDLHYSGPMVLAAGSVHKLRRLLINTIEQLEPLIAEPGEDEAHAICLDFFRVEV
jgi:hypothetical protein